MQKFVAVVTVLVAVAGPAEQALANPALPTPVPAFDVLDRNEDDRLSRSEAGYDRVFSALFASADADGDGFVSRAEYALALQATPPEARRSVTM